MTEPDFTQRDVRTWPFPHLHAEAALTDDFASEVIAWLDDSAPWRTTVASFYEQREFSLLGTDLPTRVADLCSDAFTGSVARELEGSLDAGRLGLVDVSAHRLTRGMTIGLHNDFLGPDEESHRMLFQLNKGWSPAFGGLFLTFADDDPESLVEALLPTNGSAFGFEISPRSHHAVSTVHEGVRDTLVYTFRRSR